LARFFSIAAASQLIACLKNPANAGEILLSSGLIQRLRMPIARSEKSRIGCKAETQAAQYLKKHKNFHLIARNWTHWPYEIDLIGRIADILVFVEVRARQHDALVSGYHSVNTAKRQSLARGIQHYLRGIHPKPRTYRLDIVEVRLCQVGSEPSIMHFENIPLHVHRRSR
ncbi:MAG TPA: YraN family protein, partial [Opitutales bacterium]|nr:YraN family protein [Opitutales bacterium]